MIIIIMYIYHALINALSAHMIHINLNMRFYTHVEHIVLPKQLIYIKYYKNNNTIKLTNKKQNKTKTHYKHTLTHTHTNTHTHTMTVAETGF